MKKTLLLLAIAGIIGITSCGKDSCKTCSMGTVKYEVCEDGVTGSVAGVKTQKVSLNGQSVDDYVADLKASGFSCK